MGHESGACRLPPEVRLPARARDDPSQMLDEQAQQVTRTPAEVYLNIADVQKAGSVVFRSWSPTGEVTRARIVSIETILRREASQETP